ncbi:MAG: hypothetical protein ACKVS9_02190 [Phycisphaerae bacterium]
MLLTRETAVEPLTEREQKTLERALRTLHRELRSLLAALPVEAQTASGLARWLDTERTNCQRIVSAVMQPFDGVRLAALLPGIEGLRMLADATRNKLGESATPLGELSAAIDAYELCIRQTAGSRSRLLARIEAQTRGDSSAGGDDADAQRAQLFEAAAKLTGRLSQTWLAVHIYEPSDDPARLIQTRAHGLLGHVAREDAVPLTFHIFPPNMGQTNRIDAGADEAPFRPLEPSSDPAVPAEVLQRFTSTPLPIVQTRKPDEFVAQNVEKNPDAAARPFDLVFGMTGSMAHPGRVAPYLEEVWALVNFPVRHLLLDVFLHQSIARNCIPGLDVHLWRPDFASHVGERWQTRFAAGPRLQVLGSQLAQAQASANPRQVELLNYLFEKRGLAANQYVGFRCEVSYPMWRTGYRMTLDFGDAQQPRMA